MSYNSITFFDLNLKTLTPLDKFIMRAFVDEPYLTDLYVATDKAQQLWAVGKTYCYKYIPQVPGLYPKLYEQNEIIALTFFSSWIPDPYTYDFTVPLEFEGRKYLIDEVDRQFIITRKGRNFFEGLFNALEKAKNYRTVGNYYCYNLITPPWFPPEEQYSQTIPGQTLILLWYNKNYIINAPTQNLLEKYNKKITL